MAEHSTTTSAKAGNPSNGLDRRTLIAAGAATGTVIALGAGEALGAPVTSEIPSDDPSHPDADLLALEREWHKAIAAENVANDAHTRADDHVIAVRRAVRFPAVPKRFDGPLNFAAFTDNDDVRRIKPAGARAQMHAIFAGGKNKKAWLLEAIAEGERVEAAHRQAEIDAGMEAAEAAQTDAIDRTDALETAIAEATAHTLAGAAVKARVLTIRPGIAPDETLAWSLAETVLAIAEGRA